MFTSERPLSNIERLAIWRAAKAFRSQALRDAQWSRDRKRTDIVVLLIAGALALLFAAAQLFFGAGDF